MSYTFQPVSNMRIITNQGMRLLPTFTGSIFPAVLPSTSFGSDTYNQGNYSWNITASDPNVHGSPDTEFVICDSGTDKTNSYIKVSDAINTTVTPLTLKNGNYLKLTKVSDSQYSASLWYQNNTYVTGGECAAMYPANSLSYKYFTGYGVLYCVEKDEYCWCGLGVYKTSSNTYNVNLWWTRQSSFYNWYLNSLAPEDPYWLDENNTPQGGYAGFDYTGDDVDIPALPSISAANSGFVRLYNPTITEVQHLADYLWAGAFDIATYKKLFGNPMDCFLSFGIVPVTPSRSATKENIAFANMPDPGVTAYKVIDQFAELDCGSVTIDGSKYTSSAMDYSPYTRAEIFLPFCGTHSLSVDEIMDATVGVVYHMDLYTGACVAYVKITKTNSDGSMLDSVLYQFTGNILATIPLTGADHSSFIQSILFMGAAAAATVATAGGASPEIGGAMAVGDSVSTSALGGAAISSSGINAVMSMKPNVIRSGNLSANAGFLGLKKPVITLTLPNLCRPENENKLTGMPCQKSGTLSEFSGFNIVSACHLDNIPCTMEELKMIDEALAKGVII